MDENRVKDDKIESTEPEQAQDSESPKEERLQKIIAERGLCSRRKAEELIAEGRVSVNGEVVTEMGRTFSPDVEVLVDGKKLPTREQIAARKVYLVVNKPLGFICSASDPQHRRLITELIPPQYGRVYPVGRLDINSEGLVFMTNDGDFANLITHPSSAPDKVYEVTVDSRLTSQNLDELRKGILLEDGMTAPCQVKEVGVSLNHSTGSKDWTYRITLHEGRNREVRRMMQYFDKNVLRLKRVQIGPIKLGKLKKGSYAVIPPDIVSYIVKDCEGRKLRNNYKAPRKYGE